MTSLVTAIFDWLKDRETGNALHGCFLPTPTVSAFILGMLVESWNLLTLIMFKNKDNYFLVIWFSSQKKDKNVSLPTIMI
jgi:hypothetical protein